MIQCHACGKENDAAAYECKRCRAPLREGEPPVEAATASRELGAVCRRCEAYNEPGVRVCTACGLALAAPPPPPTPTPAAPQGASPTMTSELRALSLSDEEAAEAGLPGNLPTPGIADPFQGAMSLPLPPLPGPEIAASVGGSTGVTRRPPPAFASRAPPSEPAAAAPEKPCATCGAANPPAAKFCFECGTPFGKKLSAEQAPAVRPPSIQVDTSMQAESAATDDILATTESAPFTLDDPLPDEGAAESWPPPDEAVPAESVAEALPDEVPQEQEWLPFQANLVVERGNTPGATFPLARRENPIGTAAAIRLPDDAFIAPLSATLMFIDERLVVRDEGSANGVFVKLRGSVPLSPGDHFIAGERLFRFDGPVELPQTAGNPPLAGAPRPGPGTVRVVEVLAGGRTGRTCHRAAPSLTVGRTGCDMNFPDDALLAPRHAEIRIAEDGSTTLADVAQAPSGVLLRVRRSGEQEVQGGDLLQVGEQQLRIEIA